MDDTKNQVQPEHFNTLKHNSDCQTIREIVRQLINHTFSGANLITEKSVDNNYIIYYNYNCRKENNIDSKNR